MKHTITLTRSELNTIDVTLRMRLFMIDMELDDQSMSDFHRNNLINERDRIISLLENHQVFIDLKTWYKNQIN